MKLYAQQGYSSGDKIEKGLSNGFIDGVILNPRHEHLERIFEQLKSFQDINSSADLMFDPHYYATLRAWDAEAKIGKLETKAYDYFAPRKRDFLEKEKNLLQDLEGVLAFQSRLPVTHVISPNILVAQSLDSIDAAISKSFIRNAMSVWDSVGDKRPLYVTLLVSASALEEVELLEKFLSSLLRLKNRPRGFYLLLNEDTNIARTHKVQSSIIAKWMFINHVLSIAGYDVINGCSDILTPFLTLAGGGAGATGWFSGQRSFDITAFDPRDAGSQHRKPPAPRYLSSKLLCDVKSTNLEGIRTFVPEVMNGLSSDEYFSGQGSIPKRSEEATLMALQRWQTIQHLGLSVKGLTLEEKVLWLGEEILEGNALNTRIRQETAVKIGSLTTVKYFEPLLEALKIFAELAELNISSDALKCT